MSAYFLGGGYSMVIVLLFGALALWAAIAQMRHPTERHLGTLRALSLATCFGVVGGVSANLSAVFLKIPADPELARSADLPLVVMTGLGEALAPAVLGFTLLSLAWVVVAAGSHRSPTQDAARRT